MKNILLIKACLLSLCTSLVVTICTMNILLSCSGSGRVHVSSWLNFFEFIQCYNVVSLGFYRLGAGNHSLILLCLLSERWLKQCCCGLVRMMIQVRNYINSKFFLYGSDLLVILMCISFPPVLKAQHGCIDCLALMICTELQAEESIDNFASDKILVAGKKDSNGVYVILNASI